MEGGVKEKFYQWCETTTCAGVIDYHVARTKTGRIFWLTFIIAGLLITTWQTAMLIISCYSDNPYQTTSSLVSDQPMPFPSLTVCSFNPLNKTKLRQFSTEHVDNEILRYGLLPLRVPDLSVKGPANESYENEWQKFLAKLNVKNIYELIHEFGPNCENMFLHCMFMQIPFDCCAYAKPVIGSSGKCWHLTPPPYNSGTEKPEQITAGPLFGLQLVVNPDIDSYIDGLINTNLYQQGVIVQAGFTEMINLVRMKVIEPGVQSWLSMALVQHTVKKYETPLFKPYCRQNATLEYVNVSYSKDNCVVDCWSEIYYKHCNCTSFSEPRKSYRVCDTKDYCNCVNSVCTLNDSVNPARTCRQVGMKCRSECMNPCEPYWEVDMSETKAKFIGEHLKRKLSQDWQTKFREKNLHNDTLDDFIGISLYYSSLSYTQTETGETNPIFVVIGNVGGQLSMWLGISFVTIVQAIWYLSDCILLKSTRNNHVAQSKEFR